MRSTHNAFNSLLKNVIIEFETKIPSRQNRYYSWKKLIEWKCNFWLEISNIWHGGQSRTRTLPRSRKCLIFLLQMFWTQIENIMNQEQLSISVFYDLMTFSTLSISIIFDIVISNDKKMFHVSFFILLPDLLTRELYRIYKWIFWLQFFEWSINHFEILHFEIEC